MRYEEIVEKVRKNLSDKDISNYQKHLAIQFNITGEGSGAFYIELKNGSIDVQPFEYFDRDAIVTISADNLFSILDGSLDTTAGYVDKYFDVTNLGVINEFINVIKEANIIVTEVVNETDNTIKEDVEPVVTEIQMTIETPETTEEPSETEKTIETEVEVKEVKVEKVEEKSEEEVNTTKTTTPKKTTKNTSKKNTSSRKGTGRKKK